MRLTRTKHTENCRLKKEVTKLKQEVKFQSPKKLRNTQSKTKKKIQGVRFFKQLKKDLYFFLYVDILRKM